MTVIHFLAIPLGMYQGSNIWIDKPLHIMGGMAFAMIGLLVVQRKLANADLSVGGFLILSFALFGSFMWELFEFVLFSWFNEYALRLRLYSPTVKDALFDMLFGLVGGLIIALIVSMKNSHDKRISK